MKIVVFGDDHRVGYQQGNEIVDISAAYAKFLREHNNERYPIGLADKTAPAELARFIEAGPAALENAQQAVDYLYGKAASRTGVAGEQLIHAYNEVTIHAPMPDRARVACAGANYSDHALAMAIKMHAGKEGPMPTEADARAKLREGGIRGFWKVGRDALGPDGEVIYPAWANRFDYEGEIAIIIGKKGKDIKAKDARPYIWGVTLLGDWSVRWPAEKNKGSRFATSKNFDTGFSIGPCICVGEPGLDPYDAEVQTLVNGEVRQNYRTTGMALDFGEYLEELSTDMTFHPGDIISGGTAAGTAADSSPLLADKTQSNDRYLKPGDVVEIKSPIIGSLKATIIKKPEA
jgi:2-keto-4-pentenoate hydratase/2-oxohepta-3-ene-1,7-dioic acid hydratase in catechol pathway